MMKCPKCGSLDVHRSRHRTLLENWRKAITGKRPFRCRACGTRAWDVDRGPRFSERDAEIAARAMAPDEPDEPNRGGTAFARESQLPDVDLTQLDLPEPRPARKTTLPAGPARKS